MDIEVFTIRRGDILEMPITIYIPPEYLPPFGAANITRMVRIKHDNNFNIIVEIQNDPIVLGDLTLQPIPRDHI